MSIKLFVMDVDGTMTDGKIYIGNSGEAFKSFDVKDGYGIHCILPCKQILPLKSTGRPPQRSHLFQWLFYQSFRYNTQLHRTADLRE